ncbi:MAG TPA: shikimate dehydrogenase [Thermomicrobiales bacterium]|nr:shikimate dehydrogenase [Thermomicrobiales bacterium]
MKRAGVIGYPVDHSLSPVLQNAALQELGIDATYELWPTAPEDLPARIASLREPGILGANVTVPHKQAVMDLVDSITDTARRIGAVNTIVPSAEGLVGDNTDAYGFRTSIVEQIGTPLLRTAIILGAGGASRAVIAGLQEMDATRIVITNRTDMKAASLAQEFGIEMMPWETVVEEGFLDADFLVNATSLGWGDGETPVEPKALDHLPKSAVVMDLTYRPTALLLAAGKRGHDVIDGLGMLLHQGARSFSLWTGQEAPLAAMRSALIEEQARRG